MAMMALEFRVRSSKCLKIDFFRCQLRRAILASSSEEKTMSHIFYWEFDFV